MGLLGTEVSQQRIRKKLNLRGSTRNLVESKGKKFKAQIHVMFLKDLFGDLGFQVFTKAFNNISNVKTQKDGCKMDQ